MSEELYLMCLCRGFQRISYELFSNVTLNLSFFLCPNHKSNKKKLLTLVEPTVDDVIIFLIRFDNSSPGKYECVKCEIKAEMETRSENHNHRKHVSLH